ncbi:hypothetical protein [Streptococcus sobrinus]|uniref:hypothetical protein n=2 Tax=Streptococcus sobrinus TaxID=1310 RepID=UPI0002DAB03E|nr:hypothetical protein [Streptococcus sobrinus]
MTRIIKLTKSPYLYLLLYAILYTLVSQRSLQVEGAITDYYFHLGRMVGLAQSIKYGNWLPNLNEVFSYGVGYASAMFYGNWQFYIPALFYIATEQATFSYSIFIFLLVLSSIWSTYLVFSRMSKDKQKGFWVAMTVPLVFHLFGYGMTMVVPLVPWLLYALYKVLYLDKKNPILLAVVIALLLQTHILSTVVLAISSILFLLVNFNKITLAKLLSFVISAMLGLVLSSGYLFQYLEQTHSQAFFFSWHERNFPFDSKSILITHDFFKSFTSQVQMSSGKAPFDAIFKIILLFLTICFTRLKDLSKKLLLVAWITLLATSSILPWHSVFLHTFLASFQYSTRLTFFVPLLLLLILANEWRVKYIRYFFVISSLVFLWTIVINYNSTIDGKKSSSKYLTETEKMMRSAYSGEYKEHVWSSGGEYYNIDANPMDFSGEGISEFSNLDNAEISNIRRSYNNVEFDARIIDETQPASLVVPKVWYKGYQAAYSDGARGSKPKIKYVKRTKEELKEMEKNKKPNNYKHAMYNGLIYLSLQSSGHVKLSYRRTPIQSFGFALETTSWLYVIAWTVYKRVKNH